MFGVGHQRTGGAVIKRSATPFVQYERKLLTMAQTRVEAAVRPFLGTESLPQGQTEEGASSGRIKFNNKTDLVVGNTWGDAKSRTSTAHLCGMVWRCMKSSPVQNGATDVHVRPEPLQRTTRVYYEFNAAEFVPLMAERCHVHLATGPSTSCVTFEAASFILRTRLRVRSPNW